MKYLVLPMRTSIPGLKPTSDNLRDGELAINYADDIVFRNVDGKIIEYKPVNETSQPVP